MSIILPALAVAFAAFCVWLTVRIVNRRERWAKWTAAAMAVVILYVLSIGPSAWLVGDAKPGDWSWSAYHAAYYPLLRLYDWDYDYGVPENVDGGGPFHHAIYKYLSIWGGGPCDWIDI